MPSQSMGIWFITHVRMREMSYCEFSKSEHYSTLGRSVNTGFNGLTFVGIEALITVVIKNIYPGI
jgi:hypothetical protein